MVFSTCKKSGNDYVPSWCLYYFNSPLLPSNGTDCYLWLQVDGNYGTSFSSKVTWDHIRVTSPNVSWYKVIWKEHIPRNSVVSWLALLRMLPTKDRLRRCGMNVSDICVLCNNGIETHHHFFFEWCTTQPYGFTCVFWVVYNLAQASLAINNLSPVEGEKCKNFHYNCLVSGSSSRITRPTHQRPLALHSLHTVRTKKRHTNRIRS